MRTSSLLSKILVTMKFITIGKPHERARALQEISYRVANIFGDFPFSESNQIWREDKDFLQAYRKFHPHNDFSQDRKFILKEFGRLVENDEGDIAECGSYQGSSAYFLARTNPKTSIHCIDSFEGLSEPEEIDAATSSLARSWKKGDLSSSEEVIRSNLAEFSNVVIHKGWIPDVFTKLPIRKYKLVHIDVDLYQPTKESLEYFFPKLTEKGIIILDDYGFLTCPGAKKAADEYFHSRGKTILLLTSGQGVVFNSQ